MESRKHAVLVPGFVGFDALGQLRYYAGVTSCFQAWRGSRRDVCIDFFDNFPTASVAVRAGRLKSFLAKKIVRGELAPNDELTLIGHSTGGLDIRRMLNVLTSEPGEVTLVEDRIAVPNEVLIRTIRRLVFISVPHYGTNLADYAVRFQATAQGIIKDLGKSTQLNRSPVSELRRAFSGLLPKPRADLLLAIADALNESDEGRAGTEAQLAAEREARSELGLWLEHMGKDFDVVADLTVLPDGRSGPKSPAHFTTAERTAEVAAWPAGLRTCSYVTRVPAEKVNLTTALVYLAEAAKPTALPLRLLYEPLNFTAGQWLVPVLPSLAVAARASLGLGPAAGALLALQVRPSLIFELTYALCANPNGPFRRPDPADTTAAPSVTPLRGGPALASTALDVKDSDGVVNSLSMLWPYNRQVPAQHQAFLVDADHADIIGHHSLLPQPVEPSGDRVYESYDIFESGAGFKQPQFDEVWKHIFSFAF